MADDTEQVADNIDIQFVETPIQITVDMNRLTWGDILAIQANLATGQQTEADAQEMFAAIVTKVTGQNAYELPAQAFAKLIPLIMQRAQGTLPKN